jgi:tetratricopeptide (TPR) repeat protein
VRGFGQEDGADYIRSRCELLELDETAFNASTIKSILRVTEGSPLYIEDLLRLSASTKSIDHAINAWENRSGQEARKYALGRECDLLTLPARKILLAACICDGAVSFTELEAVSGMSTETVTAALQELQKLFLVPKPRLISGEQRFEVNVNTRSLVRDVYGRSEVYKHLEAAHTTISKGVPQVGRGAVAALIKQASLLVRTKKYPEAEQLLLHALGRYKEDPYLVGALGWVYKAWEPPRLTDARERFARASQLKNTNQETYEHWCRMEWRQEEWSRAAEAAEKGLKILPENKSLLYWAGRARTRLARELVAGLHRERAEQEFASARKYLEQALKARDFSEGRDHELNALIFRGMVLLLEASADIGGLRHYFRRWKREHPVDPDRATELERISAKFNVVLDVDEIS